MSTNKERGQVLLIIILVMVVVLTVGLSVISRSITTLRTSREEASSQKALAAAEAGIEELLKANTATSIAEPSFAQDTSFTASSIEVSGANLLIQGGNNVLKDEGADIWLVPHNPPPDETPNFSLPWTGSLTIYWGDLAVACDNPAIEVAVVSGTVSLPVLTRSAHDPCSTRRSSNNFSSGSGGGTVSGKAFFRSTTISVTSGFLVRVVPLYGSTPIGVIASIALPSQGIVIDSTGDSGGTKRKINVFKGYPQLPIQYFSYGLFSP